MQVLLALFKTLQNRYYPPSIPELRHKLERSEDKERQAQDISELIEQHGAHGWVNVLIDKAGPMVQMKMEDMANFLEVVRKYVLRLCHSRLPSRGWSSSGLLISEVCRRTPR